jgi:hypothetical protein
MASFHRHAHNWFLLMTDTASAKYTLLEDGSLLVQEGKSLEGREGLTYTVAPDDDESFLDARTVDLPLVTSEDVRDIERRVEDIKELARRRHRLGEDVFAEDRTEKIESIERVLDSEMDPSRTTSRSSRSLRPNNGKALQ